MLRRLALTHVGPASSLVFEPEPRLNILLGDNGLGKTFLLDVAWWALTRTWIGKPAWPRRGTDAKPEVSYQVTGKTGDIQPVVRTFDFDDLEWSPVPQARPPMPGLVLYARVDGGFGVWDPMRNYWRDEDPRRPGKFIFSSEQVWNGLASEDGKTVYCQGLIEDWVLWQKGREPAFDQLTRVLGHLSPGDDEALVPGEPMLLDVPDARDVPSLRMPYGDVPIMHASAGVQRIVSLTYLMVWAWQQHRRAAEARGRSAEKRLVFIVDEIEAHLHPRWQRTILPALVDIASVLNHEGESLEVQLLIATHSPLVMASAETVFDLETDALFHLELVDREARIVKVPWAKQGDAVNWLVSEVFGLRQARSRDAERAIEAAEAWMRGERAELPDDLQSAQSIHQELLRVLAGHDPFWPRWVVMSGAA